MTAAAAAASLFAKATKLHQQGQLPEAEQCYRQFLHQNPNHADCLHQLGALLVQLHGAKQHKEACQLVQSAIQLSPSNARFRHSLGVVHEAAQQWSSAADAFERAVEKQPTDVKSRMHLARALKSAGRLAGSADMYRAVLKLQPDHPAAHYKLGSVLRQLGQQEAAAEAYRQHLSKDPGHVQAAFWLAALSPGSQVAACPPEIVSKLFDHYSDHFDEHLIDKLGYKTPGMLMDCILQHAAAAAAATIHDSAGSKAQQQQQQQWSRCVDLGCGTGLMGPLLRPHTQWLSGVDLSQGMVSKARERGCYDHLAVDELVAYLAGAAAAVTQQGGEPFDLLVAADVFVYLGDLAPVLTAAAAAATDRALFAFSTERLQETRHDEQASDCSVTTTSSSSSSVQQGCTSSLDQQSAATGGGAAVTYLLQTTGRYAHAPAYLKEVAEACGWQVVYLQEAEIRQNAGRPISGSLCLMQRQPRLNTSSCFA